MSRVVVRWSFSRQTVISIEKNWCKDRWEAIARKTLVLGRESCSPLFKVKILLSFERRLSLKLFTFHLPEMLSRLVFPSSNSFRAPFKMPNRERFQQRQYGAYRLTSLATDGVRVCLDYQGFSLTFLRITFPKHHIVIQFNYPKSYHQDLECSKLTRSLKDSWRINTFDDHQKDASTIAETSRTSNESNMAVQ